MVVGLRSLEIILSMANPGRSSTHQNSGLGKIQPPAEPSSRAAHLAPLTLCRCDVIHLSHNLIQSRHERPCSQVTAPPLALQVFLRIFVEGTAEASIMWNPECFMDSSLDYVCVQELGLQSVQLRVVRAPHQRNMSKS